MSDTEDPDDISDKPPSSAPEGTEAPVAAAPAGDVSLDEALSREAKKTSRMPGFGSVLGIQQGNLKKKHLKYVAGGVALLLLILMIYSCQPKQGSMAFGICSVFLELNTPYPHTLEYTGLEGSRTAVRIYYTHTDPFGEYKLEMIECTFGQDPKLGMKLTEIKRNRRPIDSDEVQKFNALLPTIMASEPYRVAPPNWKNPLLPD